MSHHAVDAKIKNGLKESTLEKLNAGKPLNRREKKEVAQYEKEKYMELRRQGWDEVSNTKEAAALRNYRLRKRKRMGLLFHRKRQTSLSQVFFPGSHPIQYQPHQPAVVVSNLMQSRRNLARYDIGHHHPAFDGTLEDAPWYYPKMYPTITLGAKLEGYSKKAYQPMQQLLNFQVQQDLGCTPIVTTTLSDKQVEFLRSLIQSQYRLHLSLDGLPVLMRSKELNYAVKGVPIGFIAPAQIIGEIDDGGNVFLYNHWRFTVTYHQDENLFEGVRITGFDVHPVTITHKNLEKDKNDDNNNIIPASCNPDGPSLENNPDTYLSLSQTSGNNNQVVFSYEVEWVRSDLPWEDRWDVYFLGLPDDAIHYFSMLNSVICMLILAAVVALALTRVFRKDLLGGTKKENGWKHLRNDVFRAPASPMWLAVLVGNGLHLLVAAIITMMLNVCHVINTMKAGEALTGWLFVYAATGSLGGYTSARLYKLCGGEHFRFNAIVTSTALSGSMVVLFCLFNVAANVIGSSCSDAVSVLELILAWVGLVGLAYWGSLLGEKAPCIPVPTETSSTVRPIPSDTRWTKYKKLSVLACGMICFGVLYVELHFLMTAIWLRQTYLGLGYMLTVTLLATIVCAECAIAVCYLQLNSEDHHWWWAAFRNGSSVGGYMVLYTFYYRFNRIELVGIYSNLAYLTCMVLGTISIGMVCGSIGFLSCLWFTRTIFSAIDLDSDDEDEEVVPLTKDVSESTEEDDYSQ